MDTLAQLLPLVLIFVVFWFLILRPARKKQQATASLRAGLDVGDTVLLGSGIYGRIESIEDQDLRLEIAPGVVVRAHRDAVVSKEQAVGASEDAPEPGPDADADGGPPRTS